MGRQQRGNELRVCIAAAGTKSYVEGFIKSVDVHGTSWFSDRTMKGDA